MIEPVTEADIPELVDICRAGHAESRYRDFRFSPEKVARTFHAALGNPDGLAVKYVTPGGIAGFFVGSRSAMEFSDDPIGVEVSFLVRPAHRGTRCAARLVAAFAAWCRHHRMPGYTAIHFADDNAATYRFIEKMGFSEIGKVFVRDHVR